MRSSSQCAVYRARVPPSISPLVFYSNVSLKSDERCNHPDRSLRNASGRSSSRATTIPWRLRCGEPIRREDPYSRKESDLDSHTCRARLFVSSSDALNRIRRDGFAFARVPIHPAKRPRSTVDGDIDFLCIATCTYFAFSWNQLAKRDRR